MLSLQNICKQYKTGELVQNALNHVSLNLRDNEFVSILGPSGSGKTTLLNIIGGLDRYDSGDLMINGISTKEYKDRDWDAYRNHTIGFVFQSYNLIPHQTVLANVELALTIGGLPRSQRRKRAVEALRQVGLGDQLHKRPSQMSGGQMQRVAIARALVNDPDILLADEPTGALDSETSLQIMDLLQQVAKDRLVVMVTHNPELAQQYSTRIVRLRDGEIQSDSDPFTPATQAQAAPAHTTMGTAKMSFSTSLALSFNNLLTKKGRTLLTAFAGSIGIIGIALILAFSTGVNQYITNIQKDTMAAYPLTIQSRTMDTSGMITLRNEMMGQAVQDESDTSNTRQEVYADTTLLEMQESVLANIKENNLTAFKQYLDDPTSAIQPYLGENGVVYSYDVPFQVFAYDADGQLVNSDADPSQVATAGSFSAFADSTTSDTGSMNIFQQMMGETTSGAENFSQLMAGANGEAVSTVVTDNYKVVYGAWPQAYNEVVLVLNQNNGIYATALYQLGLLTGQEYTQLTQQIENGEDVTPQTWDYADICNQTFYLVPACNTYAQNEDGTFSYIGDSALDEESLLENAIALTITGIIRPVEDASNATLTTAVAYTGALTDYLIAYTDASAVVLAQEDTPDVNVLTGMAFEAPSDAQKVEDVITYISRMSVSEKASLYQMILYYQAKNQAQATDSAAAAVASEAQTGAVTAGSMALDETALAAGLDRWLAATPDETLLLSLYDQWLSGSSYTENMQAFGKVSYDAPSSISIYVDSFEDKVSMEECIDQYNEAASEENRITYTDLVALLTSSMTSIIDVISYVLIAFVAVSLVVSCIMIGIITHISVLERTKEIGILRALGASKGNISQVFNAETVIIGLCSGLLGVGVSALLTLPINAVLAKLLGNATVHVFLPWAAAAILVILSVGITVLGGLLPAKSAAKKDPVIALRSE